MITVQPKKRCTIAQKRAMAAYIYKYNPEGLEKYKLKHPEMYSEEEQLKMRPRRGGARKKVLIEKLESFLEKHPEFRDQFVETSKSPTAECAYCKLPTSGKMFIHKPCAERVADDYLKLKNKIFIRGTQDSDYDPQKDIEDLNNMKFILSHDLA